ncbi:uncharacterized protein EURHEDRAFT_459340 [Aspergillus ruber CBS 135680]|uniref:Uncharacterized protein n=1 Tax=Aspergillus ruber (strain CBS 135680) TaxID=1388766 RepID=A0A017SAG4_ASPRC|nr:uncharacterized protein EURHEDRAFT_459340 [Aspergillus ruber CBS 135680]EYE93811.1 hypothetical protein EURHEDRAFT_459340 [Aspergillus ruber CBS 135680]
MSCDDKHQDRHAIIDSNDNIDPGKSRPHKHKRSKSRDIRFPRTMSQIASSTGAGARALLPTWSGSGSKEKDREGDDGLLRPVTRDTSRTRWGSDSTSGVGTGSRRGSFLEGVEQSDRIGPPRQQEVRSPGDLEQVTSRRKQAEEYLRSALVSIGTLATDTTRRLDYTYYNLLEKITALNTTISSFQGLADSTSTIFNEFEREVAGMYQEINRQVGELGEFQPQLEKVEALEERMKRSREKAEALEGRLEKMKDEVSRWEKKEVEWQSRVNRRLRIFWGVVMAAMLALVIAVVVQNWPFVDSSQARLRTTSLDNQTSGIPLHRDSTAISKMKDQKSEPNLNHRQTASAAGTSPTEADPLKMFDEL